MLAFTFDNIDMLTASNTFRYIVFIDTCWFLLKKYFHL